MSILMGFVGVVVLLGIAFIFSNNRKSINPRTIFGALALQMSIPASCTFDRLRCSRT